MTKTALLLGFICPLAAVSAVALAQSFDNEVDTGVGSIPVKLDFEPSVLTTSSMTYIRVSHESCLFVEPNAIYVDTNKQTVDISLAISEIGFLCPVPPSYDIPIANLAVAGEYRVEVYSEERAQNLIPFDNQNLFWDFDVEVSLSSSTFNAETPAESSVQSGIGLVRGWACDAKTVEVQFDDLPRLRIPYGSNREDTTAVCGDNNNGYGAVVAWSSLGSGTHTMRTFIDGRSRSVVTFEVSGLDEPFVKGLSAIYELPEFPASGESVVIQWSEADQNFIITDHLK